MKDLDWRTCGFQQLSNDQLYDLLRLRVEVFVVEQACAYLELDGVDKEPTTLHLLGYARHYPGPARLLAYARILAPRRDRPAPAIGRVLVASPCRGQGIATVLVKRAIGLAQQQWPGRDIRISAQCYLKPFYASLGFRPISSPYLEDGIAHIDMRKAAD